MLRTLEERDIRFVRLWFTDVLGYLKSVRSRPPSSKARSRRASGSTARRSRASPGSTRPTCSPSRTRRRSRSCRWAASCPASGRMFCDILLPDGTPSYADPRYVLKRALARAADLGFTFYTHPEIEFFLLREKPEPGDRPRPIDSGGYFDHTPHSIAHDFRRRRSRCWRAMGISVEFSHHEGAPGQQEIDLRYADALTTADNIMTFRLAMKEVALDQGVYATLHAQAVHRAPRLGHAHPHVAVRGRPQRVLRAGRRVPALQGRPGVHRRAARATPPRSPRSATSG